MIRVHPFRFSSRFAGLLLALVVLVAAPVLAEAQVDFWFNVGLFTDDDGSGGLSCGDRVQSIFGFDSDRTFDLTNVRVEVPFPSNLDVIPNTIHPGSDVTSDCQVLEGQSLGDRRAVIECSFVCATGNPDCAANGVGFGIHFRLRDPNDQTSIELLPVLTADQTGGGTLVARDIGRSMTYAACPAAVPPFLVAQLEDSLVGDLDGDGLVDLGDTLRYTATVFNTGGAEAQDVRVTVPPPAHGELVVGSVTTSIGTGVVQGNAPGDAVVEARLGTVSTTNPRSVEFLVQVGEPPANVTQLVTQGLVEALNASGQPTDDPGTAAVQDPTVTPLDSDPDLAVTKSSVASARPGQQVVWTVGYANQGRATAPRAVVMETVPAHTRFVDSASSPGWSCADGSAPGTVCVLALGDVVPGGSGSREFAVRVVEPLAAGVEATENEVVVTDDGSQGPDSNLDDNVARRTLALEAEPDLWVSKGDPGFAVPGELVIYPVGYGNHGSQEATAVRIVETVPDWTVFVPESSNGDWICTEGGQPGAVCVVEVGSLASGESGTVHFAVRVEESLPFGVEETVNRVHIEDDGTNGADADPTNNQDQVVTPLEAAPAMVVEKSGPSSARPGEVVVFQLDYRNDGDQEAIGVDLHEAVPEHTVFVAGASTPGWSCEDGAVGGSFCVLARGSVPAGGGGTVAFAVRVVPVLPAGVEVLRNRVSLMRELGDDPPGETPGDEVDVPVEAAPDLVVTKTGPAEASEGMALDYTLTVSNVGEQDASGVVLTEEPPSLAAFDAAGSDPRWSCGGDPVECRLELGVVPGGTSLPPVPFRLVLPEEVPAEVDAVINAASVGDDGQGGADPDSSNNSDEVLTLITREAEPPPEGEPLLEATLVDHLPEDDGDGAAQAGEVIAYAALIRNTGNAEATGLEVTVPLDLRTRYREGSVTTTAGTVEVQEADGGEPARVLVSLGGLGAGDSVTVTWETAVEDPLSAGPSWIEVQGTVASDQVAEVRTDDPDTRPRLDPTRTPLDDGSGVEPPLEEIPTLSQVGLLLLVGLLLALAIRRMRQSEGEEVGS